MVHKSIYQVYYCDIYCMYKFLPWIFVHIDLSQPIWVCDESPDTLWRFVVVVVVVLKLTMLLDVFRYNQQLISSLRLNSFFFFFFFAYFSCPSTYLSLPVKFTAQDLKVYKQKHWNQFFFSSETMQKKLLFLFSFYREWKLIILLLTISILYHAMFNFDFCLVVVEL